MPVGRGDLNGGGGHTSSDHRGCRGAHIELERLERQTGLLEVSGRELLETLREASQIVSVRENGSNEGLLRGL